MQIDYRRPLCLIVGLLWQTCLAKKRRGRKEKDGTKVRTLNIGVVPGGLMRLTMPVNTPPSFLPAQMSSHEVADQDQLHCDS